MQTKERTPTTLKSVRDWERTDLIAAATAIVIVLLFIWTLALVASSNSTVGDLKNMVSQQQNQITELQSQIADNERKREQDTALMLRNGSTGSNLNLGSPNGAKSGTALGAPSTDQNGQTQTGQTQTGGTGNETSPGGQGY